MEPALPIQRQERFGLNTDTQERRTAEEHSFAESAVFCVLSKVQKRIVPKSVVEVSPAKYWFPNKQGLILSFSDMGHKNITEYLLFGC